jgi:hypothetical protein
VYKSSAMSMMTMATKTANSAIDTRRAFGVIKVDLILILLPHYVLAALPNWPTLVK